MREVTETAPLDVLVAPGPLPEHADKLELFGQFVGSWNIEATYFAPDGTKRGARRGEWHFGWALQGRAVQDVIISPPLSEIEAGAPVAEYGTTIRFYDSRIDAWQVTYVAPVAGVTVNLVARPVDDAIVLEGRLPNGHPCRWEFTEIRHDEFRWRGYQSPDEGDTWFMDEEMLVRRRAA